MKRDSIPVAPTQAALDQRWQKRVREFVSGVDSTWQAVQLIDFVPRPTCVKPDHDGGGIKLTAYDPNSIMNYCNHEKTALTALDQEGFQKAYSFLKPASCRDTNPECGVWASRGECSNNPSYLQMQCCAWAADNQCNANPNYMEPFCCASCQSD